MNLDELEEELSVVLPGPFSIRKGKGNKIVIYTTLVEKEDGELESDEDDDSNEEEFDLEDEDIESLDALEDDDE